MNANERVHYWLDLSEYDLATAKVMLEGERYLYVGFMCHQCIEKILKAAFCKWKEEQVPYTHSLLKLAKECGLYEKFSEEQKDILDKLDPLNIEARYPSYKEKLLESLTDETCAALIRETEGFQRWLRNQL
jgi:HEPN domain-containing protein